jgi:hypothetical protein
MKYLDISKEQFNQLDTSQIVIAHSEDDGSLQCFPLEEMAEWKQEEESETLSTNSEVLEWWVLESESEYDPTTTQILFVLDGKLYTKEKGPEFGGS